MTLNPILLYQPKHHYYNMKLKDKLTSESEHVPSQNVVAQCKTGFSYSSKYERFPVEDSLTLPSTQ